MPVANLGDYPFGTALANDNTVAKTADKGFVFALSVINSNVRTVSVYEIGFGLCDAGVYNYGETLYIKDGVFTKEENGAIAGYVNQAVTLEKKGYVMLRKK